jgi:hypothetical protein
VKPRQSRDPKRRLASSARLDLPGRQALALAAKYVGSAIHKKHPGDYRFHPPVNPRAWKSLCDDQRVILKAEASDLLRQGALRGLFSDFPDGGKPKYIWSVDAHGEVFEAMIDSEGYHGYRLENEDDLRSLILKEWANRCSPG